MSTAEQEKDELQVFESFVAAAPLPILPGSARKLEEPAPDIECELEDGSKLAFELTEVLDEDIARENAAFQEDFDLFPKIIGELSSEDKRKFEDTYCNIMFSVTFTDKSNRNQKKQAAAALVPHLLSNEIDTFPMSNYEVLKVPKRRKFSVLKNVYLIRTTVGVRKFDVTAGGAFFIPVEETLGAKFAKTYISNHPVELLAYFDEQPNIEPDIWLPSAKKFVEEKLAGSPFRRVWVYDLNDSSFLLVHPE